jgi:hypothetical protein
MFSKRLQILIDEPRHQRLVAHAREHNLSIGAAIREALDAAIPVAATERRAAARRVLAAEAMPVPPPPALRAELDELRGRRG